MSRAMTRVIAAGNDSRPANAGERTRLTLKPGTPAAHWIIRDVSLDSRCRIAPSQAWR